MSNLWETAKQFQGLAWFLAPVVIPKVYKFMVQRRRSARPLPFNIGLTVLCLMMMAACQIIISGGISIGRFSASWSLPENVIVLTESRIWTSGDVIGSRLAALNKRVDTVLIERLISQEGRLLYAMYGPAVSECKWCDIQNPNSLLMYSIPTILLPYMINAVVVLISTTVWTRETNQWRGTTIVWLALLAMFDLYSYVRYPVSNNLATRLAGDVDWFLWRKTMSRGLILAVYNLVVAGIFYLSGTGWVYNMGELPEHRIMRLYQQLDHSLGKLKIAGMLRLLVGENDDYRDKYVAHWTSRQQSWDELLGDDEVKEALECARLNINLKRTRQEADEFVNAYG
jgi:hypothetical protein